MSLLGFKTNKQFLGIDIGTTSLKLVELSLKNGRPALYTYGLAEQMGDVKIDADGQMQKMGALLATLVERSHAQSKKVVAALPSFSVFSSVITLPNMAERELAAAIRWEAKKFVPMPLEEMVLDWKILEPVALKPSTVPILQAEDKGENKTPQAPALGIRVLITAAPNILVQRYLKIFQYAKLELLSLETESFALERSLVGADATPVLLLDIGGTLATLVIVEHGIPVLTRTLDIGGNFLTQAIANGMGVDLKRAEQFKRDVGFTKQAAGTTNPILTATFKPLINELKYVLDIWKGQNHPLVEKVVLSGGSAFLSGLPDYLTQETGLKVVLGNPWQFIVYPQELEPVLSEVGPRLAIACGLALREFV